MQRGSIVILSHVVIKIYNKKPKMIGKKAWHMQQQNRHCGSDDDQLLLAQDISNILHLLHSQASKNL